MVSTVYHSKVDKTGFHQEFSCPAAVFNQKSHADHAVAKRRFAHAVSSPLSSLLIGHADLDLDPIVLSNPRSAPRTCTRRPSNAVYVKSDSRKQK